MHGSETTMIIMCTYQYFQATKILNSSVYDAETILLFAQISTHNKYLQNKKRNLVILGDTRKHYNPHLTSALIDNSINTFLTYTQHPSHYIFFPKSSFSTFFGRFLQVCHISSGQLDFRSFFGKLNSCRRTDSRAGS